MRVSGRYFHIKFDITQEGEDGDGSHDDTRAALLVRVTGATARFGVAAVDLADKVVEYLQNEDYWY